MQNNIPEIEELLKLISKFPGLGPKSARRIVLKLINNREELAKPLVIHWRKFIKMCPDVKFVVILNLQIPIVHVLIKIMIKFVLWNRFKISG